MWIFLRQEITGKIINNLFSKYSLTILIHYIDYFWWIKKNMEENFHFFSNTENFSVYMIYSLFFLKIGTPSILYNNFKVDFFKTLKHYEQLIFFFFFCYRFITYKCRTHSLQLNSTSTQTGCLNFVDSFRFRF